MKAYQTVQKARDVHRLSAMDLIQALCDRFVEFHGDRVQADDQALIGGIGLVDGQAWTLIGIQKGRDTEENLKRNFGSSGPAGYRKAQRLMKQADKFNRPVLTLINTAGANATPESEEHGIGEAIASTLTVMSELTVPSLAIILGEGGSGGAIALALADEVWMLSNAVYSILSPEGFASILWKDSKLAPQAAEMMKLTAGDLLDLGVIDQIISEETETGATYANETLAKLMVPKIKAKIKELSGMDVASRQELKYQRFRKF
ncbi:carboxyltransferase subunit alpha [Hutsoniella sourekii]|uniref:carboxyltransferase subunit alpha n=1 Tax=Hutsoniella sourekii TaxID=87650 RepID=UPI0004859DF8|nr:carboxyltransferase subunit alpha [Hutsoniella sourekii]